MTRKRITLILAMLVLAVFAIGAVSAADDIATDIEEPTEDIAIDDIAVDDDSVDETVEIEETQTRDVTYDVNAGTTDIQSVINDRETTTHVVTFEKAQYNLTDALTIHGNVTLYGNGATLVGSGNNIFSIAGANNFTITGFNIITNSTKAAFYGANVFNANISYNNITGGKDGINIMQTHDNLTITGNKITGFTRDGISIVDHRTLNDTEWANRGYSVISNNVITGISIASTEVGMFFGGNFKGTITGNNITATQKGMEFAGKKAATNGRLCVELNYNRIVGVTTGINMNHPDVISFKMLNNTVNSTSNTTFAILAGNNFDVDNHAVISLINNTFYGYTSSDFYDEITENINNTGLISYP